MRPHLLRYTKWKSLLQKCGDVWTVILALTIIVLVLIFLATFVIRYVDYVQIIHIDTRSRPKFTTSTHFLSIGLDSIVVAEGFKNFNMTDPKLINNIKYLSPAFLRVGGNLADRLLFVSDDLEADVNVQNFYINNFNESDIFSYTQAPNFTMTGSQWLALMQMANFAGLDVIFDLNSLIRFSNGSWDHRNAESLINFSNKNNLRLNWELGNEPNAYKHKFNEQVNATQLAKDFLKLRNILKKYPLYSTSYLFGPDVDRMITKPNERYLKQFVKHAVNIVDVVTWHQYYINGRTAKPEDFLNPDIFDTLKEQIDTVRSIVVDETPQPFKPIWLGETSSAYGGGAPNLSDTFIGSFIWVDKLGIAAKMGLQGIVRQSIYRGHYALLNNDYNPNPDWWISVLYKRLVGRRVLQYYTTISSSVLRFYVHCTRRNGGFSDTNALTVFGINLKNTSSKVRIEGYDSSEFDHTSILYSFELTTGESLISKTVKLNGVKLELLPNQQLPSLVPKVINILPYVVIPPLSVVFWVIPSPGATACS